MILVRPVSEERAGKSLGRFVDRRTRLGNGMIKDGFFYKDRGTQNLVAGNFVLLNPFLACDRLENNLKSLNKSRYCINEQFLACLVRFFTPQK